MKKICGLSTDFIGFLGVLLFLGLLAGIIALPDYNRRRIGPLNWVFNNLRIIEGAKDQWAIENKKENGALPTISDLAPYLKNGKIQIGPAKEKYNINAIGTPASAIAPVKLGTYPARSVIDAR